MSTSKEARGWIILGVVAIGGYVLYEIGAPFFDLLKNLFGLANDAVNTAKGVGNAVSHLPGAVTSFPTEMWRAISSVWGNCSWQPRDQWISGVGPGGAPFDTTLLSDKGTGWWNASDMFATWAVVATMSDKRSSADLVARDFTATAAGTTVGQALLGAIKKNIATTSDVNALAQKVYQQMAKDISCGGGDYTFVHVVGGYMIQDVYTALTGKMVQLKPLGT